ncbi:predicted protein [Sclerotinia sclerotiorum 1980 UF-70]|uniref:Uncharacterized protein n=1 Tax=Sclerotinia sclerotiorum (strain ATCC 18683 / 1980 / Ss-1) TaxID=665079 RepID=A7EYM6_SCLS1|nr:predicted protein [Sclerotinia sclerotiorum 1980 UF-70]EDN94568.1 predicted protein [Sclerotinia sclerotiorum 1980 UF-70]
MLRSIVLQFGLVTCRLVTCFPGKQFTEIKAAMVVDLSYHILSYLSRAADPSLEPPLW